MLNDVLPLGFALVAGILAALSSLLARRIGAPGAGLLCAVFIGALLGPTVLGRIAPTFLDRAWIGSPEETSELRRIDAEYGAWMHLVDTRARELKPFDENEIALRRDAWQQQREEIIHANHAAPGVLVLLLACGLLAASCIRTSNAGGSLLVGAWIIVVCGGFLLFVARFTEPMQSLSEAAWMALGASVATAAGSSGRPGRRALAATARLATILALVVFVVLSSISDMTYWPSIMLLVAGAIGFACLIDDPTQRRRIEFLARSIVAPAIIAITLLDIDLVNETELSWVPIAAWLSMSDLRWVVGMSLFRNSGASWSRAAASSLPLMGGGWLAIAIAGAGYWSGQLSEVAVLWLILAAAVAEIEGDWRGNAARVIRQTRRTQESTDPGEPG